MASMRWLFLVPLLAGCAKPPVTPAVPGLAVAPDGMSGGEPSRTTISYGGGPQRVLDLYVPDGTKDEPLVAFVHGGAWQSGSRHEYDVVAERLRGEGIAVATVDYRLSPQARHPAPAEDVAHALGWLRMHSTAYRYDPSRIVVVGHSAGAHIAGMIATDPALLALAGPVGFVGLEGIYDVPDLARRWPAYPSAFLDNAFGADPARWPAASPTRRKLAAKVPWLLVHSDADELVDAGQTDGFARHLRTAGVPVSVLKVKGESHFGVVQGLAEGNEAIGAIRRFVKGR